MKCRPHSSKSTLYLLVTYLDKIYNPHSLEEYIPSNRFPKSCLVLTRNIYISHKMSVFHLSRYIVSNLFKLRPYSCKMVSIFRPSLLRLPGFNLMNLALLKIYGLGISWTSLFMIMYHLFVSDLLQPWNPKRAKFYNISASGSFKPIFESVTISYVIHVPCIVL